MLHAILKQKLAQFGRQTDGTTAIEFSVLAIPFMMLVFGILELAIVFFTTTSLQHNLTTNTRSLRVGAENAICGEIEDIKVDVCNDLNVNGCLGNLNLNISRVNSNQFDSTVLTQFQASNFTVNEDDDSVEIADADALAAGISGNEIIIIKAVYQHDLILPGRLTRLANFGLKNKRVLTVTQAVRTEPFPNVTCS